MELPKKILEEIEDFCKLNEIKDKNKFILSILQTGFNVEKYGNTSSATIPIALHEANANGLINPGDYVLMTVIGGGLAWGAMIVRWDDYCAS